MSEPLTLYRCRCAARDRPSGTGSSVLPDRAPRAMQRRPPTSVQDDHPCETLRVFRRGRRAPLWDALHAINSTPRSDEGDADIGPAVEALAAFPVTWP
jgi:hypothetical protein